MSVGPSEATLRAGPWRGRWPGLSANDATLLAVWLGGGEVRPDELHTHVPMGSLPFEASDMEDPHTRRMIESAWPRRIDCAMRVGPVWWVIECKPDADHHALGQVLCYAHWWRRDLPGLRLDRVIVLTDRMDEDCRSAYAEFGVEAVEVGELFERTRRRVRTVIGE